MQIIAHLLVVLLHSLSKTGTYRWTIALFVARLKRRTQGSQHNQKLLFTESHALTPPLYRVLKGHVHSLGLQQTSQLVST